MNEVIHNPQPITMTSREIADLVGKEHHHVMRDLRSLRDQLGEMFGGSIQKWIHPQNRSEYDEFVLDKDTCLTLLLGYDAKARMKVVKRWQELEAAVTPRFQIPTTLAGALRLAAEQAEEIERQQKLIEQQRPAVEFVDKYVNVATGEKGFREVCKLLNANEARFREFLIDEKIMYRLGKKLAAHKNHELAGRFRSLTGINETNNHSYTTSKFTPKGVEWVAGEWARYQLRQHGLH